jgi:long-chain fatty acid transport protein
VHRREILPGFVFAVLLARPLPARPGGFEYGVNGAEAVGRAGAFTARGDNPTTLYYNPAGMGRMEPGTHLLLDANLVLRTLEFRRAGEMDFVGPNNYRVDGLRYPRVRDEGGVFPAPFFALVTDLGLDTDFQFGFGAFGPAAVGRASFPSQVWVVNHDDQRIPVPAPQRYDLLFMDVLFVWPTLAASRR